MGEQTFLLLQPVSARGLGLPSGPPVPATGRRTARCANVGLDCVVEGVETEEELDALKALGGASVQEYLFSPPLPERDAMEFALRHGYRGNKIRV